MKVIFWDIDGVLNTPATWGAWAKLGDAASIEPDLVAKARQLHLDTGAKAVLSSTWRLGKGTPTTVQCLVERGWPEAQDLFIGSTPYLAGCQRGEEIGLWLASHPEVTRFAVVDDAGDMLGVVHHHVQTDFREGLTNDACEKVKDLLT